MQIHQPGLCPLYERDVVPNSLEELYSEKDEDLHQGQAFSYLNIGWLKTWMIQAVLTQGYACLSTDTDIVFFKNPFSAIQPTAHIAVSPDKLDDYTGEDRWATIITSG
jgi:hypothetical protein